MSISPPSPWLRFILHLLKQAPWARTRLRAHAGKHFRITPPFPLPAIDLCITDSGLVSPRNSGSPDLIIELEENAFAALLEGKSVHQLPMKIQGDAEVAEAVGFVLRNLKWDYEADLSHWLGDLAAFRLANGLRGCASGLQDLGRSSSENLVEFCTQESGLLVSRLRFEQHCNELRGLRDALARLDKRTARL